MLADINFSMLEGKVVGNVHETTTDNGDRAMNFTIETQTGKGKFHCHSVVLWNTFIDKFKDKVQNGVFVRVEGFLQPSTLNYVDSEGRSKTLSYDRLNVRFIAMDDE